MCSGCSGDYAGDYEEPAGDEFAADADVAPRPSMEASHAGSDGEGTASTRPGRAQPSPSHHLHDSEAETVDSYEVFVSSDTITELRTARICHVRSPSGDTRGIARRWASLSDLSRSSAGTAGNYRTPPPERSTRGPLHRELLIGLILLSLSVYAVGAVGFWLTVR